MRINSVQEGVKTTINNLNTITVTIFLGETSLLNVAQHAKTEYLEMFYPFTSSQENRHFHPLGNNEKIQQQFTRI
jgi:hypothetical protein